MSRRGHALDRQLVRRVERVLRDFGLAPGGSLIIAVSGGPDSLALTHILWRLKESLRLTLYGAHLDHGIRGQEAHDDATFVQNTLWGLHIPAFIRRVSLARLKPSLHLPSEAVAREFRYRFLAELTQELHADAVAVAHTADDQAETVLMHLLRGAGIGGLVGMEHINTLPVNDLSVRILRPLLEIPKEETRMYCELMGLNPRQDSTNLSLEPLRNRIRLQLLPAMEQYNPAIKVALRRLGLGAARTVDFLDEQIRSVWGQVVKEDTEGISIDRRAVSSMHAAVQAHLLRAAYAWFIGSAQQLEHSHVEQMLHGVGGFTGSNIQLPGGVTFRIEHSRALLTKAHGESKRVPPLTKAQPLSVPGTTRVPGWIVAADLITPDLQAVQLGESETHKVDLDLDALGSQLWVRSRLQGDRFQPLGMAQEKRLQDFLVDAHVPSHLRDNIPLVVGDKGIVWVVGHRIADWVRLTPYTERAVRLTFSR